MQSINSRMATGIVWMVAARLMDRLIGIVSTLILARILVPGDFGLVAMATAIGGILDLMGAFSFDVALIQNAKAERRHYDTVWTFGLIFGVFCGVCLIALAHPVATFYSEPRLVAIMYVLSVSYFVGAFGNVGVVAFRKELNFHQEFTFIFARRAITFIVTIGAAYLLRSYWALLIGMTVGRIASCWLSYRMNAYRPRLTLVASRELMGFSKWLLINNILFFILHDGCTFIIGRLFGPTELGIYSVAYEISSLPSTELVAPINRATFPGFSKMDGVATIAASYVQLFGMISLCILPIGIGIAAVAEPLVLTLLGPKWIAAIPLIQLLAFHGAFAATQGNNGPVWMALGHPRSTTIAAALFLLVLLPSIYIFLQMFGIVGAGYAYILANACTLPYGMIVSSRLLNLRWRVLLASIWRPLTGVAIMYVSVRLLLTHMSASAPLVVLIAGSAVGALTYIIVVLSLWLAAGSPVGAERFVIDKILLTGRKLGLSH